MSKFTPAIPDIPLSVGEDIARVLNPIKETIDLREGRKGKLPNESMVTLQNLIDLGLIAQTDIDNKLR